MVLFLFMQDEGKDMKEKEIIFLEPLGHFD
jgi:hypothetical protein